MNKRQQWQEIQDKHPGLAEFMLEWMESGIKDEHGNLVKGGKFAEIKIFLAVPSCQDTIIPGVVQKDAAQSASR